MSEKHTEKLFLFYILLCCGLMSVCAGCGKSAGHKGKTKKFEIDKDYQRGPLTVHVRVDKSKLTIADTIELRLEASVKPGYKVKMPEVGKNLKDFGIVDWDDLGDALGENNNVISTCQYRLAPFLSGSYSLPTFKFVFYDVNSPDKKYTLTTEPIGIKVASLLGEQRAKLKIAGIEGVVSIPAKPSYWWIWVPSAAIILTGLIFWIKRRGRRAKEIIRIFKPAHEIAYQRLQALVAQKLIEAGKIKEFHERISDILRHYIEHRFNLKAPERTTEEFLAELTCANLLARTQQERLAEFLQHCDMVKFARYTPKMEQIQKTFDMVKTFIETTKSEEKKIDVTESEQPIEVETA